MSSDSNPASASLPSSAKFYCVWFFGAAAEGLYDLPFCNQRWQDMVVVPATSEEHAVEVAHELIKARSATETTITRVMGEQELEQCLCTLRRVQKENCLPQVSTMKIPKTGASVSWSERNRAAAFAGCNSAVAGHRFARLNSAFSGKRGSRDWLPL